jgi:hypothetical protein
MGVGVATIKKYKVGRTFTNILQVYGYDESSKVFIDDF